MPTGAVARRRRAGQAFYEALTHDDPVQLYEKAPVGYLSTTPDGLIVKVNETFLTWTGYERTDLVGVRRFADLLTGGGRIYHETHYAPMLHLEGGVREIALDIVRADGDRLPVLVNASLDRDEDGEPRVVRVALFDATERREYERELLRATRRAEESEAQARALATTLQQTFVPPRPPDVRDLDVAGVHRPATRGLDMGGDFFDVFQVGRDEWAVTLGDVCGKGIGAAVVTSLVRHTIRALVLAEESPAAVLARLNDIMLAERTERFCTVVLLRLRRIPGGWQGRLCTAGHPPALILGADGEVTEAGDDGTLLGALEQVELDDVDLVLGPGTGLLLYTDGVTEARRGSDFFGQQGIVDAVSRLGGTAAELAHGLVEAAVTYQPEAPRDDIAVVALRTPDSLA